MQVINPSFNGCFTECLLCDRQYTNTKGSVAYGVDVVDPHEVLFFCLLEMNHGPKAP